MMPEHEDSQLHINPDLSIPLGELRWRFVRSRGPGGQHVNKTATQVELTFDVANSPSLSDTQRQRCMTALKKYLDGRGVLHLESQSTRSQLRNRQDVLRRFQSLLREALKPRKKRRATRPSVASKEQRIETKKRRGAVKRARRTPDVED